MNYLLYNKLAGQVTLDKAKEIVTKFNDKFPNMELVDEENCSLEELNNKLADEDNVLLIGGDGTVNFFANAWHNTKIKGHWYIYSAGTGNDFLTDVEAKDGFSSLNEYMDNLPTVEANGVKKYFINNVGYGVDGDVCVIAEEKKKKNKKINYANISIGLILFGFKKRYCKVKVDGVEHEFKRCFIAATMNGRYYGGGMKSAPNQDRKGDKLTLVIMTGRSRLLTLIRFTKIFKGEHTKYKKTVFLYEGKEIEVSFDKPCGLQYDGEVILNVSKYKVSK